MILEFKGRYPKVDPTAFIAENAVVTGDVEIGQGTNIWFHSVVRGDLSYIQIGANYNIQDASILHVEYKLPLIIEDHVVTILSTKLNPMLRPIPAIRQKVGITRDRESKSLEHLVGHGDFGLERPPPLVPLGWYSLPQRGRRKFL